MKNFLTFLVCFLLFAAGIYYIATHSGNPSPAAPLTNAQAASQACALAGEVAAANGGTALYTPLLFAAAAQLNAVTNSVSD